MHLFSRVVEMYIEIIPNLVTILVQLLFSTSVTFPSSRFGCSDKVLSTYVILSILIETKSSILNLSTFALDAFIFLL